LRPLEGVRELRGRRMLSQQELADLAGVSLFTVQRIERGEGSVRPKTGRAIANALGVTVEELLPQGKAQAPLFPPEPSFYDELLAEERRKRFRDLAGYARKLHAMFAELYDERPDSPTKEDLDRVGNKLTSYAAALFAFLDALDEGGAKAEMAEYFEAKDPDAPGADEIEELSALLVATLAEALPSVATWLIEQTKARGIAAPGTPSICRLPGAARRRVGSFVA
jgi:transcriptional regulator with XRE-family HTH domain